MNTPQSGPILVVEADRQLADLLAEQLMADGYAVDVARTGEHARLLARIRAPTAVVLGWLGAPRAALALLEEIRHPAGHRAPWDARLPAIVLSARANQLDMLRAFEAGADDFLARPGSYLELRARLRALLRRARGGSWDRHLIHVGPIAIDTATHAVALDGSEIVLRRMEFELLAHLAREPERVFATDELLRVVWGYRSGGSTRTVASHASRLRRKLARNDADDWIVNVRGVGYRLT